MQIETAPPPLGKIRRSKYAEFMRALAAAPGEWVSLPLTEVKGDNEQEKQTMIHAAARYRGCKVTTTCQEGRIFARIKNAD